MHCVRRGGLAPSLILHPYPPFLPSRRFLTFPTLSSKNVTKTTKQALNATAENFLKRARSRRAGFAPPRAHRATELKLVNTILEETRIPSVSEKEFPDARRPIAPLIEEVEEGTSMLPSGVGPGALVEIRWKTHPLIGVVLRDVFDDEGRNMIHTLLADGRIICHFSHDIFYLVPKFIDPFHIKRCGFEDRPTNSKELMARVSAAEKLRTWNKSAEDLFNGYATPLAAVYSKVSASDKDAWASVTIAEAAKLLKVQHPNDSLVLHAVYSRLMKDSHMFVMDRHNFLSTQTFYVRPRSHVERFDRVWHLMHHDLPRVRQFASRAREIIVGLRKETENSRDQAPSSKPAPDFVFTDDDQLFVQFFLDSLVDMRSAQDNRYTPFVCDIIKSLNLYDGDVDSAQVRQFLVDLGVFPPWQDIVSLKEANPPVMVATTGSIPPVKGKQVSKMTAITSPLGPDDFYPSDLLESIRHDFGQLPVYVIDDYGAQELDDGISIERDMTDPSNLWIHVHVADPTAILPPSHSLAHRARNATHTHYFYHGSQPMLPDSLVNGRLSLGNRAQNGQAENVMTFSAMVDSGGDIVDYRVRAGIIRNVQMLRYDDVDTAMSFDPHLVTFPFGQPIESLHTPPSLSPADRENLRLLDVFSRRMVARRLGMATFIHGLERPELNVLPKQLPVNMVDLMRPGLFLGYPQISYAVHNTCIMGTRQIISETAQVANRVASLFGRDHGIPLVRRSLAGPVVRSDEALADLLSLRDKNGWVDLFHVRRKAIQLSSSRYTLEPAGHWTTGVAEGEGYVRVTSPLRRYGDMVTHWQIKHALLHQEPLFSSQQMQTTFDHIGTMEQRWKWIRKSHDKWWVLAFVKSWMESGRKVGAYNPLETMIGRVTMRARQDIVRGTWTQEVHIAKLGLFGNLEQEHAETDSEIGAEVAVAIEEIVLGTHPILRLKLAGT